MKVINLEKTTYSKEEVEQFFGKKMNVVLRREHVINKGMDFSDFADGISHPQTGEHLRAIKGYADNNGKFYYVEYENKQGEKYCYIVGPNNEDIRELIYNDQYADKREEFSNFMEDNKEFQADEESYSLNVSQNCEYDYDYEYDNNVSNSSEEHQDEQELTR